MPKPSSIISAPLPSERQTQDRIIQLFREELGYEYLGNWAYRAKNSNVEEELLEISLRKRGYSDLQISQAIYNLKREISNPDRQLIEINERVYSLLRYGIGVKVEVGSMTETVHFIDWKNPENNHFAIAEEVTLRGGQERRPDLVLYINGIAIGVLELKNSRVSIGEGVRQSLSNQTKEHNAEFFGTNQFIFAGNDSEGLQYGTIGTEAKYFLKWKEDEQDNSRYKLDKYLLKMCNKARIAELMYDFILFDGGKKKLPRVHQYFGIKAAQESIRKGEKPDDKGGIIWHTQGSGKSIVMILLAKWIMENYANARIAIITDRDELDVQMIGNLQKAGVISEIDAKENVRASSGRDLMHKLGQTTPRLICTLVHKFGKRGKEDEFEAYCKQLENNPPKSEGDLFVFVDECHRTQSGRLNRLMKAILRGAVFIGFTGTPLLKEDKQLSTEVFGKYIHTYKFKEAVEDEVVLDLTYEARDIDQRITSESKVDQWFDAKTKNLNDWQKRELADHWAKMKNLLSAKARMNRIVGDILLDFATKRRLDDNRGNAILVASSILDACRYFKLFEQTELGNKCAIITSYDPNPQNMSKEETGASTETDSKFIFNTYTEILKGVPIKAKKSKTEIYEEDAKDKFIKHPALMRLLIVVDKLLTGFDAPPCTYLYIDKSMQDHGLFQAICRTNRLDGEDKDFGYIVDYKNLFQSVEKAISVYTSELDDSSDGGDPSIQLKERLTKAKERLELARDQYQYLVQPVANPAEDINWIHYFCGNSEVASELKEREPLRAEFYKTVVKLVRSYRNLVDEMGAAGYSETEIARVKKEVDNALGKRETVRLASGEHLDLKPYEADMRQLLDTYIEATDSRKISAFDGIGLLDLIVNTGIAEAIASQLGGLKGDENAIAETIENNVRSKIVKEHLLDPDFYSRMSEMLDELIKLRKSKAVNYSEYLKKVTELSKKVNVGKDDDVPEKLDTDGKRRLYNNLKKIWS